LKSYRDGGTAREKKGKEKKKAGVLTRDPATDQGVVSKADKGREPTLTERSGERAEESKLGELRWWAQRPGRVCERAPGGFGRGLKRGSLPKHNDSLRAYRGSTRGARGGAGSQNAPQEGAWPGVVASLVRSPSDPKNGLELLSRSGESINDNGPR